jgi:glucosyl-dolichyl phosphate glucuronosyltransferase
MDNDVNISIIICTYNRCASLQRTLESLLALRSPPGVRHELLVVDNNSSDGTRAVVESYTSKLSCPVRYVFEPVPGQSHARNTALRLAQGEILAWTDDDVLVAPNWLAAIHTAFSDPLAVCAGGKALPLWEAPPPLWLSARNYSPIVALDLGDQPVILQSDEIVGANFAVRVGMFTKYGQFRTNFSRTPKKLWGGEDMEFFSRLIRGGEKVLYYPEMVVQHCVPKSRMTAAYHFRWHFDSGEQEALTMGQQPARNLLGVPYFVIRKSFVIPLWQLLASLFGASDVKMYSLFRLAGFLGFVKGRFRWLTQRLRNSTAKTPDVTTLTHC